tara:strand:+ start:233 stop:901 length:669 start_codon:yes stop_codon:yes gene_type:complete
MLGNTDLTELNNIDVFGSWMEIGMAAAVVLIGMACVFIPIIRKLRLDKSMIALKYPISFNWDIHTRVHETLTELRVRTDSARTQVIQFHNGGQFLDGISMKKFSCTHESINVGVSPEGDYKKELIITRFMPLLDLVKNNSPELYIVDSLEDTYTKQYLQNTNVVAFSVLPLRKKNEILGYVMCEWCSWGKADEIDEQAMIEEMNMARNSIEVQLNEQSNLYK